MTSDAETSGNITAKLAKIIPIRFSKPETRELNDDIKNRESWVKVFIAVFSVLIVGWKLLRTPIELDGPVSFNDLLLVGLAVFSIALSWMFYMKAASEMAASYRQMIQLMREVLLLGNSGAEKFEHLVSAAPKTDTSEPELQETVEFQQQEREKIEKFYDIFFSRITLTDIMNYEKRELDLKFAELAMGLPTSDIEFLLQNQYITNDWQLSDTAHTLILELKDRFRMKADA